MHIYLFWPLTPELPSIFEVPEQLFLLGIDTIDGSACCLEALLLDLDVFKLLIALRMSRTGFVLFTFTRNKRPTVGGLMLCPRSLRRSPK